jgi:hypothetical protein
MSIPVPDVSFTKYVNVFESLHINKTIDAHIDVKGTAATADATADALGANTVTQTLTQTTVAQGIGSSSVSESVSAATKDFHFTW